MPADNTNRARIAQAHGTAIEEVVHILRREPEAVLSLGDMAEMAALSPHHFCRVFRSIVGIPPVEFQAALRLDLAKRLLLTTPLSVTEICFAVGYHSPGTFTSRFTRSVGLPPRLLRRLASEEGFVSIPSSHSESGGDGSGSAIHGHLYGPEDFSGLIFAGLFPSPIPQSRPVAGAVLSGPGPYRLAPVPDGRWFLLAAALPASAQREERLLLPPTILVGAGEKALILWRGRVTGNPDVRLRALHPLDPPLLIALPLLLVQATSGKPDRLQQEYR